MHFVTLHKSHNSEGHCKAPCDESYLTLLLFCYGCVFDQTSNITYQNYICFHCTMEVMKISPNLGKYSPNFLHGLLPLVIYFILI